MAELAQKYGEGLEQDLFQSDWQEEFGEVKNNSGSLA